MSDDKASQATEVQCAIQGVMQAATESTGFLDRLEAQLEKLPDRLAAIGGDTIKFGCELRKSIIRIMKINEKGLEIFHSVVEACEAVSTLLVSFSWDIANDLHIISALFGEDGWVHKLFDLFSEMKSRLLRTIDCIKAVKRHVVAWVKEAKNTASDIYDTIEEDFHELESCVRQLVLSVMLAGRAMYRQVGCPQRESAPGQSSLEDSLVSPGPTTMEDMKQMADKLGSIVEHDALGDDAVTTIGTIEQETLQLQKELKGHYDNLIDWWDDLTRPADCKDAATLGMDRIVDAVGLGISAIVGLCDIPGEMRRARDIVNTSESLWPKVDEHWKKVWENFVDTMEKLCNHLYIDLPQRFRDLDAKNNVVFSSSNRNFLSFAEHVILNFNCGPCMEGPISMCRSARDAGKRFYVRTYWKITQFHLVRPVDDYMELLDQRR